MFNLSKEFIEPLGFDCYKSTDVYLIISKGFQSYTLILFHVTVNNNIEILISFIYYLA